MLTGPRPIARALGVLALSLLAAAPTAAASTRQTMFFEAPRDLTVAGTTTAGRTKALGELATLGVRALRVNVRWYDLAPTPEAAARPAFDAADTASYDWGAYGQVIDEAKKRGWTVLISPSSPVPKWATASGADTVTRPNPAEFRLFTTALARRFAGANVIWSIWNEPNLDKFLLPQQIDGRFVAGRLYRDLFLSGRAGIESVEPDATVLFGETAPSSLVEGRQKPIAFLRDAFCVDAKGLFDKSCGKLSIDGVADHPYRSIQGIPSDLDDVTYQVVPRLTRALDRFAEAGAINASRPVYLTQFGIQSYPDDLFGVPLQTQVEERARAEHIAYDNPRVRGFSQYLLTDDPPIGSGHAGSESGLRLATGKDKPAFDGFRLVMDARPQSKRRISIWGLVRPARRAVSVTIERRTGGGFVKWKTLRTKSNGVFTTTDRREKELQYRYRWTSASGKRYVSAAVRPYSG